jgi:23S rRNA (adenine2503-C2)-methyltransferase
LAYLLIKGVNDTEEELLEFSRLVKELGEKLISTLKHSLKELSSSRRKKIALAYLLIKGVNDTEEELLEFSRLVKELGLRAVLLYYNSTKPDFEAPSPEEYERAFLTLKAQGIKVTLSTRYRKDKLGGCGTLLVNRSL